MLNATLTLTATPELLNTLNKIADAFSNTKAQANVTPTQKQKAEIGQTPQKPQQPAPLYQAPVQQVVPGNIPAAYPQPAQQIQQQVPIQQQPMQMPAAPQAIPTAAQSYTMDQLALAATQLIDAGRMTELQQLLASFGVQALTALPKEQYGAFATKLREMGAKI